MTKKGISIEQAKKIREEKGIEDTKLQQARLKKGYSQNQLSVVSGIARRTIQCYEQRERAIDSAHLETLCALCLALDCKIEDILESKDLIEKFKMVK